MIFIYPTLIKICWLILSAMLLLPQFVVIPIGAQLLINSITAVTLGTLLSAPIHKKAPKDKESEELERIDDEEADEEIMGTKDALMFPIVASVSLCVLYFLVKTINQALVSKLLKLYFSFLGMYALGLFFSHSIVEKYAPYKTVILEKKIKIPMITEESGYDLKITKGDMFGFSASFIISGYYFFTNFWMFNNIIGLAFTIGGIKLFKLNNWKIGLVILWGLFLYDIFWVFYTDVMVTVAKMVDGPILLKFPINLFEQEKKYSMLGLGDMLVPGGFVSLALKFDIDRFIKKNKKGNPVDIVPVFWAFQVLFYAIGILVTYVNMVVFKHAQPALLYLVPAATIAVFAGCVIDGVGLEEIWNYEAVIENKEKKTEDQKKEAEEEEKLDKEVQEANARKRRGE